MKLYYGSNVEVNNPKIIPPKRKLDFGTGFDFFGERAHTNSTLVTEEQKNNRDYLKTIMEESGFVNLPEEWWHYTLKDEPFPETYFNFPVNATLIKQGN